MLFNSFAFAVFLPIVFTLYWAMRRFGVRAQNVIVLVASYVFYGWWDWRFLTLIVASSAVDFVVALRLDAATDSRVRRAWLGVSLAANLGALGLFKYYDFFAVSLVDAMASIGWELEARTLGLILPVGISFYTFQTLSYTLDVYRGHATTTRDPVAFFAFVSFFPQLVAGPIERARELLPQFLTDRRFDRSAASDGVRQALWGLFKKAVIADNLAPYVNGVFAAPDSHGSVTVVLGVAYFAIQIYCDFSGYSDIAIGVARLFGFRLSRNFAFPYFSRDIAEFWRRWHISLSTWFRDYLYVPLGGSRAGRAARVRNVMITFAASGLWHGANWTFLVWGVLHGVCFLPGILLKRIPSRGIVAESRSFPRIGECRQMVLTFTVVCVGWVFFRSDSVSDAVALIERVLALDVDGPIRGRGGLPYCAAVLGIEWVQRREQHGLQVARLPVLVRWLVYWMIASAILLLGSTGHVPFIYFQF